MTSTKPFKGFTETVHEHGFVRYIDCMGVDIDILEAARISYRSPSKGEEADRKLLKFLFRNQHTSPFEMVKIKFNIKLPIFVMRQYVRHRMQNLNEVSARYTELPNEFYLPRVGEWRGQSTTNKQSSSGLIDDQLEARTVAEAAYEETYQAYQQLLALGVAREQARIVLPVGIYTEIYSLWDLNNLLKFFALRDSSHAQSEIKDYATAMKSITSLCFPWVMEIYEKSQKVREELGSEVHRLWSEEE